MANVSLTSWQTVTSQPPLLMNSVHLWRFSLGDEPLPDILNYKEKERAQRLRVPEKAKAFVVARTRMRQIVAGYLGASPDAIQFVTNEHGKPELSGAYEGRLVFNLSHSRAVGLLALTLDGSVGVDVEAVDEGLNVTPLAERFFSIKENAWLTSTGRARQQRNFYRLWTRKEAWLKGKGGGFSEPDLELDRRHIGVCSSFANGWFVKNFAVARGYVGALAVQGEVERVERFVF